MPQIYLAVDNCFAAKRWTTPAAWGRVIGDEMGLRYVEASADNEIDPLYAPAAARHAWLRQVRRLQASRGVRVANLYSGHGTYATLGLTHHDKRVRDHILKNWLRPMARMAGELGAGLGFFAHAFAQDVLNDPTLYHAFWEDLAERLATTAQYGRETGAGAVAIEQMYSPHQPPWTLAGTQRLLAHVWQKYQAPLYVTIDVGHACGQQRFLRPDIDSLRQDLEAGRCQRGAYTPWLGSSHAQALWSRALATQGRIQAKVLNELAADIRAHPYLFAQAEDGDPYAWLERFAPYSPIIHLQQTDNTSSAHKAFTTEHNNHGIIEPRRVLRAIHAAYKRPHNRALPPRVDKIYLTLEMFSTTADHPDAIVARMRESAAYWRQAVPQDGRRLDELNVAP